MKRLSGQDWIGSAQTVAVLDALESAGGKARFVGGCVRDALIGREVSDIDIATDLAPELVVRAVRQAGLKAVPTGIEHGTVTVVSSGRPYEVTTLRRDVSTDGRRATVAFTTEWREDAQRRDFRLNALYADRHGTVFDPTGDGVADAEAGRIVFVGDPEHRIREDYLRILRFFRFRAWFGRGEPDAAALAACARLKDGLSQLSAERISAEVLKLLAAPDPRAAVHIMAETGVLERVLPWTTSGKLFLPMIRISADPILRLSSLLPEDPGVVRQAAETLRLSNAQKARLVEAVSNGCDISVDMASAEARAALYRIGRQAFRDRLFRAWAAEPLSATGAEALLALADDWIRPAFPITGEDLKAAGISAGPAMGRILTALEGWWVDHDFPESGIEDRLAGLIAQEGA